MHPINETESESRMNKTEPASYVNWKAGSARYASGSLIGTIFNFAILTFVSRLHFGQYNGKFSKTVSVYTFIRVLLLQ